ncbi:MAG: SDR family oxidoreductase [Rhodothermales bacterium]
MILVTGATGFLGSVLVRQLLAEDEPVRILRRASSALDLLGDAADHVEHAVGDVTDAASVREAMRGVASVYHTAAFVGFGGASDADKLHAVNVAGTAHVVDAALAEGIGRLVLTSSQAAFGRAEKPTGVIDETAVWVPSKTNTAYARSKHQAELEVHRGVAEGLDAVIVNPSMIFGPGRAGENTMEIVDKVRRGRMPAAPAGGTNVVDVEDVAAGHRAAMARGETGERYFLGSENLRWKTILDTLAEAFGVRGPRVVLPPPLALLAGTLSEAVAAVTRTRPTLTRETARISAHPFHYDNAKAREALGVTFRPFRATAERIAAAQSASPRP